MEQPPPATDHVLRPHHVALLTIIMMAFKDLEIKKFPTPFALHLHRFLMNEVAEVRVGCRCSWKYYMRFIREKVATRKSHDEVMSEICSGPSADAVQCSEFQIAIKSIVSSRPRQ